MPEAVVPTEQRLANCPVYGTDKPEQFMEQLINNLLEARRYNMSFGERSCIPDSKPARQKQRALKREDPVANSLVLT